jgi:transcriptional regulator with XRE-family HTH domain
VPRRKATIGKPLPRPDVLRPLGAQLRRLRLEQKLSQERLAERAGLNYKYIGRIELGKADPGAAVLVRLAAALTVPVGALFETITPAETGARRYSPADAESLSDALGSLTTAIENLLGRKARSIPVRAPRRPRR